MSFACLLEWPQVSYAQYLALAEKLESSGKVSRRNIAYDGTRLIVIGVWESQPALSLFLNYGLGAALSGVHLPHPRVTTWSLPGPSAAEDTQASQMMAAALLQIGLENNWN
jgi:hypothetical protein